MHLLTSLAHSSLGESDKGIGLLFTKVLVSINKIPILLRGLKDLLKHIAPARAEKPESEGITFSMK